jgi:hypothetical protein
MPGFPSLLDGGALNQDIILIEHLLDLAKGWAEKGGQVADFPSLAALIAAAVTEVDSKPVKDAFAKLGLEPIRKELATLLGKVVIAKNQVPDWVQKLLSKNSNFHATADHMETGLINWTVVDASKDGLGGADYKVGFGGSAKLAFEAADAWPGPDPMDGSFLRIEADIALKADASVDLPFNIGKVSGGASASGSAELEYYFDAGAADELYGVTLANRLRRLPSPFDFQAVWSGFGPEAAGGGLAALVYTLDGDTSAKITVSIADSLAIAAGLEAAIGATLEVSASMSAKYSLTLQRPAPATASHSILAILSKGRQTTEGLSAGLGVTVDISQLTARAQAVLQSASKVWSGALADIQPYLSPGTWLQTQAGALLQTAASNLVGNKELQAALVRDLRGAIGLQTNSTPALIGWIQNELVGAFERSGVIADATKAADATVENLATRLPAFAEDRFRKALTGEIDKLGAEITKQLEARVKAIVADNAASQALTDVLKSLNVDVTQGVGKLNQLLAGVRELVARYDKLFQQVVSDAEAALKSKVSARLQIDETQTQKTTYQIVGTFTSNSAEAGEVFDALVRGRLELLLDIFNGKTSKSGFTLSADRSSITRYSARDTKVGFELVVLTFADLKDELLVHGDATSTVTPSGGVTVGSNAQVAAMKQGWADQVTAGFAEAYNIAIAAGQAGGPPSAQRVLEMGVTLGHQSRTLTRVQVEGFVGLLAQKKLLPADTPARASALFDRWTKLAPGATLDADINAKLWFTTPQVLNLLRLSSRQNGALSDADKRELVDWTIQNLVDTGAAPLLHKEIKVAFSLFKPQPPSLTEAEIVLSFHKFVNSLDQPLLPPAESDLYNRFTSKQGGAPGPDSGDLGTMESIIDLIDLMGRIYLAQPAGAQPASGTWNDRDYQRAQTQIAGDAARWLQLSINRNSFDRQLQPRLVAFLKIITAFAGAASSPPFSLVMTNRPPGGKTETVVLA